MPIVTSYRFSCDGVGCDVSENIGTQDGRSQVTSEIMKRGWELQKGGKILCPICIKKRNPVRKD